MSDRTKPVSTTAARPIDSLQDGRGKWISGSDKHQQATNVEYNRRIVRILCACDRIQELIYELRRYRWDIIGLSEVRLVKHQQRMNKIWFSGEEKNDRGLV